MLRFTKVSVTFLFMISLFRVGFGISSQQRTYFNGLPPHVCSDWLEDISRVTLGGNRALVALSIGTQNDDANELAIVLQRLINASYNGFRDLRAGTGRRSDETVTYPCSMSVPRASSTVIRISDDVPPYVSAKFYSGTDRAKAKRTYGDLVSKVKAILSNWHGDEREKVSNVSTSWDYSSRLDDNSPRVSVGFTAYVESGNCSVNLTIWAPESLTPNSPQNNVETTPWQGGPLERLSRQVVQKLVAGDYEGIRTNFNSQMKANLSAEMLERGWNMLVQQFGSFRSQDQPQTRQAHGYNIVTIICRMDRGAIEVEADYDTDGNIGGLWLRPANPFQ